MIKIFVHGCVNCGVNGALIRSLKRQYQDIEVINSRYNKSNLEQHLSYLQSANMFTGEYQPIVVKDGEVSRLRSWNA